MRQCSGRSLLCQMDNFTYASSNTSSHECHYFHVMISFLVIITSTALLRVVVNHKRCGNKPRRAPLPPGPTPWPIIGNLPELILHKPRSRWVDGLPDKYNSEIACVRVNDVHIIPVKCPELAREFLKKQDTRFMYRPDTVCSELASSGYKMAALSLGGETWKKMKRVLTTEMLNPKRLSWLHDKRKEEADNIVRYIHNHCMVNAGVMEIRRVSKAYAGNVIRRLLFNKRYFVEARIDGGPGEHEIEHVEGIFTILSHIYAFCVSDYFPILKGFDLDGHEKIIRETMSNCISKYHDPQILQRLKEWRDADDNFRVKKREPQDLLDVLVSLQDENGQPLLSFTEIQATCSEISYASIDNPSNTAEWALAELVNNRDHYCKAIEEIDRVVGKEKLVQESDFPKLNYVKACLRETFRLHPSTCFNLPHLCNTDAMVGGYFIPKGSHVLLSRVQLGVNPKTWKDPLKFIPERHLTDPSVNVTLHEPELRFISFSTGYRGCTGAQLGSAMTIMLFARLLQAFEWEMQPGDSSIDLTASRSSFFMEKRLHLVPKPRLLSHMYEML